MTSELAIACSPEFSAALLLFLCHESRSPVTSIPCSEVELGEEWRMALTHSTCWLLQGKITNWMWGFDPCGGVQAVTACCSARVCTVLRQGCRAALVSGAGAGRSAGSQLRNAFYPERWIFRRGDQSSRRIL